MSNEQLQNLFIVMGEPVENYFGVILYKQQFRANPNVACELRKKHPQLVIMVDQEGGEVVNIENIALPAHPRKKYSQAEFEKLTKLAAKDLKEKCIDINLAPVVERNWRSYTSLERIHTFSRIMMEEGVFPVLKHFPGKPGPCKSAKGLTDFNLLPKSEIEICVYPAKTIWKSADRFSMVTTPLIMMSNRIYPAISPLPALFDPVFANKLRSKGFSGIILSDALWEFGISSHPQNIIKALKSVDLVMVSDQKSIQLALELIRASVAIGEIDTKFYLEKIEKVKKMRQKIISLRESKLRNKSDLFLFSK